MPRKRTGNNQILYQMLRKNWQECTCCIARCNWN